MKKPKRVVLGEGHPQFLKRFVDDQQLIGLYDYQNSRNLKLFNQHRIHGKRIRLIAEILTTEKKS